jgi:hypothetical protein
MKDKASDAGPTPSWTAASGTIALEGTFN